MTGPDLAIESEVGMVMTTSGWFTVEVTCSGTIV